MCPTFHTLGWRDISAQLHGAVVLKTEEILFTAFFEGDLEENDFYLKPTYGNN